MPASHTTKSHLHNNLVLVGTWNVNGKKPDLKTVKSWLQHAIAQQPDTEGVAESEPRMPDIVVVGLQEMVELNPKNIAFSDKESKSYTQVWSQMVVTALNLPIDDAPTRTDNESPSEENGASENEPAAVPSTADDENASHMAAYIRKQTSSGALLPPPKPPRQKQENLRGPVGIRLSPGGTSGGKNVTK